VLDILCWTI